MGATNPGVDAIGHHAARRPTKPVDVHTEIDIDSPADVVASIR